jgi:hypothetical protein
MFSVDIQALSAQRDPWCARVGDPSLVPDLLFLLRGGVP